MASPPDWLVSYFRAELLLYRRVDMRLVKTALQVLYLSLNFEIVSQTFAESRLERRLRLHDLSAMLHRQKFSKRPELRTGILLEVLQTQSSKMLRLLSIKLLHMCLIFKLRISVQVVVCLVHYYKILRVNNIPAVS